MSVRYRLAALTALLLAAHAAAQLPTMPPGGPPGPPGPPGLLPTGLTPPPDRTAPGTPKPADGLMPTPDTTVRLPSRERFTPVDVTTLSVRPQSDNWQLWSGTTVLHSFGRNNQGAEEARRVLRDLRPTVWATIGEPAVVGYGVTGGRLPAGVPSPRQSTPVDLGTVRAENVKGAWCLRDEANILLNFGLRRGQAEQAAAACKRYGFNRIGVIESPQTPPFTFFYAAPVTSSGAVATSPLAMAAQEDGLTRSGVPVPGLGFVGERVVIDPRQLEVRKERGEFVLAHAADVFARFGPNEWAARDAQRVVQDGRFTEFCRVGELTFFLINGRAPARIPFAAQGTPFQPATLKPRPIDGRWGVYEPGGRVMFGAATQAEADQVVRVIQAFQFDQVCRVGQSPRASLTFLVRTNGR